MPDGRSSNYNGRTQGGSNTDSVLADSYVKGLRGQINWEDGYSAMVKDTEVTRPNTNPDPMAPYFTTKKGRGALPDCEIRIYHYSNFQSSGFSAVDYAYNDFGQARR